MIHKKATWTGEGGVSRISSAGARNSRSPRFIPEILPGVLSSANLGQASTLAPESAGAGGRDRAHAAISAGWL